jgi:hypothetical protein
MRAPFRVVLHLVLLVGVGEAVATSCASTSGAPADSSTAIHSRRAGRGVIALASARVGLRLATTVRFPAGVGLGLAVCTAGIVLEVDEWLRSRRR